jgi:Protein of unknown function (DUF4244)
VRAPSVRSVPVRSMSVCSGPVRSVPLRVAARLHSATASADAGMTTAEYAVGTVGACGFGGVLIALLKSEAVQQALKAIVMKALSFGGIG